MNPEKSLPDEHHPPLEDLGKSFGIFYPVGYLVAAFPLHADARLVQQDLLAGGYEEEDCALYTAEEVEEAAERNLAGQTGFLARLGWSDIAVQTHLGAAQHGATFLLIYAPGDTDSGRAMNVIRRHPHAFVHRYHRFTIEEMK